MINAIFSTRYQIQFEDNKAIKVARYEGLIGQVMSLIGKAIEVKSNDKTFYLNKMSIVKHMQPLMAPSGETIDALKGKIFPKESKSLTESALKSLLENYLPHIELKPIKVEETAEQKRIKALRAERERLVSFQEGRILHLQNQIGESNGKYVMKRIEKGESTRKMEEFFENEGTNIYTKERLRDHLEGDELNEAVEMRNDLRSMRQVKELLTKPDLIAGGIAEREGQISTYNAKIQAMKDELQVEIISIESEIEDLDRYNTQLQQQKECANNKIKDWKHNLLNMIDLTTELYSLSDKIKAAENELATARRRLVEAETNRCTVELSLGNSPEAAMIGRLADEVDLLKRVRVIDRQLY